VRRRLHAAADRLDRSLPWSRCGDPWAIYVSEVMLQQTPVARVRAPWRSFLDAYPTPTACADASLADVLRGWGTLGFPRRARSLHLAARVMRDEHAGRVPDSLEALEALPGVGPYTARAVGSFAYAVAVGVLDTNVGRILARAVVNEPLSRARAQALADAIVDPADSARTNQALLDLGAIHCRAAPTCEGCPLDGLCRWRRHGGEDPSRASAGVSRAQGVFEGSARQRRGRLLARLRAAPLANAEALEVLGGSLADATALLGTLVDDGLVAADGRTVALATG
jgi:A/G-specific adenine glycosylase